MIPLTPIQSNVTISTHFWCMVISHHSPGPKMEPLLPKYEIELNSLMASVNDCFRKGLITEPELIKIEKTTRLYDKKMKIYELMKIKDEETALQLFYDVVRAGCVLKDETKDCNAGLPQKSSPMELGPIVKCIFEFLDVNEIKSCRYVCKEWNSIAKTMLRARAKVVIREDNLEWKFRRIDCIDSTFLKVFSGTPSLDDLPFTAFKIENANQWSFDELNDFFQNHHTNIKELELEDFVCSGGARTRTTVPRLRLESVNITEWIAESKMSVANSKYNTKLSVSSSGGSVMYIMNSFNLMWVKDLSLRLCRVNLQPDVRINPIKLALHGVNYFRNGKPLQAVTVNDFLNFSNLKKFQLSSSVAFNSPLSINNKIILDVSTPDKLTLNSLTINSVVVTNWETSTWTVDTLSMENIPILRKIGMKVSELSFRSATINISSLPESLTTLCIHTIGNKTKLACPSESIYLPNLKYVYCEMICNSDNSFLWYFRNCPSLVSLDLVSYELSQKKHVLELSWLPRNLKNLKLKGLTVFFRDCNKDLILDNLILDEYSLYEAWSVHNIRSNNLVLNWKPKFDTNFKLFQFLEDLIAEYGMYNVSVGPFDWRICPFKDSCLADYVDKESQYYIFENLKGRAIAKKEFDKLLEL